jgi:uncharacterized membrane protein (UPF0127 family)|tara:strand:+ start:2331 stop:2684 length:354 start_codon:yes stop_codon:yes gene_type:complete
MNAIINNQHIPLEIMTTPQAKSTGMMGRDSLDGGMLFPFNEIGEKSFWMKDCNIPLDIVFISGNKITDISENCQPCEEINCPSYRGIGDSVLELPGGFCNKNNVSSGDRINFDGLSF